ncbi:putative short-subunit dehydrogenase-like oxidoreductase (DUF2520 family) [Paucibacter oligotrophus]|uniref:Putative short-subunit dehydrogenase-like oxidoreductase (DUF2520 family) n=1 Tax=Roseateles oligotrophus TaxID=1769250 RepID=A0A840LHE1_9BURK|nr:DUF2520 domain-containing protein [Roseateles oligotrophus]MBB4844687.1 putative short-subunit dehydrogenase-like oxidoreductase (DUF2520 family) [Roseateles oligotrophus]
MAYPSIAFIGAGRLGQTLALALARRGEPLRAIASRRPASAQALAAQIPGCQALSAEQAVAAAELVFLSVPDDEIAGLAQALPWRAGQAVLHCSGATELAALGPALAAGAAVGGFHPLQIFSDPQQALGLLAGSTVAIESADAGLQAELLRLAGRLEMRPLSLPPGARAAYHGAASFAASFILSLLDEAAEVWARLGLPREQALPALLPLAQGTLQAAQSRGLAGALSGPISRGDCGVVAAHLQAFDGLGEAHGRFYRELARRQLDLAAQAGRLDAATLAALRALLS